MKMYTKQELVIALKEVGLKKNDTVFVNTELYKFGVLDGVKKKEDYFKIFFDAINEIISKGGTLATNSYSFQTLRYGEKFVYEKTKCSSGKFSEFIRSRGDSLRSDHPVFSVSAIGKNKKYICSKNSLHNYGYGSRYDKMLKLNGYILKLAMEPCFNPLLHYVDSLVGVAYYYNKLTKLKYYKKGKKINKSFSSYVRYLNLDIKRNLNTFKKINHILRKNKIVKSTNLGSSKIHLIDAQKYLDVILDILYDDQFALVDNLTFLKNQIPNK